MAVRGDRFAGATQADVGIAEVLPRSGVVWLEGQAGTQVSYGTRVVPQAGVEAGEVEVGAGIAAGLGLYSQTLDLGHVGLNAPMGGVLLFGVPATPQMAVRGSQLQPDIGMQRVERECPLKSGGRLAVPLQLGSGNAEPDVSLHRRGVELDCGRERLQGLTDPSYL